VRPSLQTAATNWPLFISQMTYGKESNGGITLTGENGRTRRKTCPSVSMSVINTTRTGPGAKLGFRCEPEPWHSLRFWLPAPYSMAQVMLGEIG
jgi:hypothetical protein